jgi:hypothetical protein
VKQANAAMVIGIAAKQVSAEIATEIAMEIATAVDTNVAPILGATAARETAAASVSVVRAITDKVVAPAVAAAPAAAAPAAAVARLAAVARARAAIPAAAARDRTPSRTEPANSASFSRRIGRR